MQPKIKETIDNLEADLFDQGKVLQKRTILANFKKTICDNKTLSGADLMYILNHADRKGETDLIKFTYLDAVIGNTAFNQVLKHNDFQMLLEYAAKPDLDTLDAKNLFKSVTVNIHENRSSLSVDDLISLLDYAAAEGVDTEVKQEILEAVQDNIRNRNRLSGDDLISLLDYAGTQVPGLQKAIRWAVLSNIESSLMHRDQNLTFNDLMKLLDYAGKQGPDLKKAILNAVQENIINPRADHKQKLTFDDLMKLLDYAAAEGVDTEVKQAILDVVVKKIKNPQLNEDVKQQLLARAKKQQQEIKQPKEEAEVETEELHDARDTLVNSTKTHLEETSTVNSVEETSTETNPLQVLSAALNAAATKDGFYNHLQDTLKRKDNGIEELKQNKLYEAAMAIATKKGDGKFEITQDSLQKGFKDGGLYEACLKVINFMLSIIGKEAIVSNRKRVENFRKKCLEKQRQSSQQWL